MTVLEIITHPNKILETKCDKTTIFDKNLWKLLDNMYETMLKHDGVGLAAPQVGIKRQAAVIDINDYNGKIELINPIILQTNGEQIGLEGCLSFPGLYGEVKRYNYVKVKAKNRYGKTFIIEGRGYLARALQHEIDHLNGELFTQHVRKYYEEDELVEV